MHQQTPSLKITQVLVAALIVGMVVATGTFVALKMTGSLKASPSPVPVETFMMALGALAIVDTIALLVVPGMMIKKGAERYRAAATDADRETVLLTTLQTVTIIKCAMVEGVGLFGAVIFLVTGAWPALIAPALATLVLLAFFPTAGKAQAFREKLERAMLK